VTQQDGFLTIFSIEKGWRQKYTQLKWLWIGVSGISGVVLGLASWIWAPQILIPACLGGTLLGAGLFYLFLKRLKEKSD
jgi:hypothetical protein